MKDYPVLSTNSGQLTGPVFGRGLKESLETCSSACEERRQCLRPELEACSAAGCADLLRCDQRRKKTLEEMCTLLF